MRKDANGIYVNNNVEKVSTVFSDQSQDGLYSIEDGSWWFQLRAKLILNASRHFFKKSVLTVDVGGGNGYTTMVMQKAGYRMGLLEPSYLACIHAKERGIEPVICGSVGKKGISWKQCMLLDVLEHIEDDEEFLMQLYKQMKPNGRLIITVPALKMLWSSEDDEAGHFRRYDEKTLTGVLQKAGFRVRYCSYFFSWLVLPVLIVRVWMEKIGLLKATQQRTYEEKMEIEEHQFKQKSIIVNKVLSLLNNIEIAVIKMRKHLLFGSSLICLAEKT